MISEWDDLENTEVNCFCGFKGMSKWIDDGTGLHQIHGRTYRDVQMVEVCPGCDEPIFDHWKPSGLIEEAKRLYGNDALPMLEFYLDGQKDPEFIDVINDALLELRN